MKKRERNGGEGGNGLERGEREERKRECVGEGEIDGGDIGGGRGTEREGERWREGGM